MGKRAKYTRWSEIFEIDKYWIKVWNGITNTKDIVAYRYRQRGYQIRFLKSPRGKIRYQLRRKL